MYVVERYGYPILYKPEELTADQKILFEGTQWECESFIDDWVSKQETLKQSLKLIKQVIGTDMNKFDDTGNYKSFCELMKQINQELLDKVIVCTLYDKCHRRTDGRLWEVNCKFVEQLHAKYGQVSDAYRCYEHPYLWDQALTYYRKWREEQHE